MSKFTLINEDESSEGDGISRKLTVEFEAITLSEILDELEYFLRGAGYHLKGHLVIEEEDTYQLTPSEIEARRVKKEEDEFEDTELFNNGR